MKKFIVLFIMFTSMFTYGYGVKGMKWGVRKSDYYTPHPRQNMSDPVDTGKSVKVETYKPSGSARLSYSQKLATIRTANQIIRTMIYARNSFSRSSMSKKRYELALEKFNKQKKCLTEKIYDIDSSLANIRNKGYTNTDTYREMSKKSSEFHAQLADVDSSIQKLKDGTFDLRTDEEKVADEKIDKKVARVKEISRKLASDEFVEQSELIELDELTKELDTYIKENNLQDTKSE